MTNDRDFKQHVRARAKKTGESYQAARRQLEENRPPFAARVTSLFRTPSGIAFGCFIDRGKVSRGMKVTVRLNDQVIHQGIVASLRHGQADIESVSEGQFSAGFGMIVEPHYNGTVPDAVTG
jgi:translation initiation factor IF-2